MGVNDYKDQSVQTFNKQADNYHSTFFGKHARSLYNYVLDEIKIDTYDSVLDVGCGRGDVLALIVSKDNKIKAHGVDLSPKMLKFANHKLKEQAVLKMGDSENIPWNSDEFSLVTCTDSFHHYPNPQIALSEMYRVLKQSGKLIISEIWLPTPARQVTNMVLPMMKTGDVRIYSKNELTYMLDKCGFKNIVWKRLNMMAYLCTAEK